MAWETGINWVWEETPKAGDVSARGCLCGRILWHLVSCSAFMEGDCHTSPTVFAILGAVVLSSRRAELVDKHLSYFHTCCLMDRSREMWSRTSGNTVERSFQAKPRGMSTQADSSFSLCRKVLGRWYNTLGSFGYETTLLN